MKWVILGAGRSGQGAKELLGTQGKKDIFFYDENPELLEKVPPEERLDIDHPIFKEKDLTFILSPGFPPDHQILVQRKKTWILLSEIDFALQNFHGDLIAVTGTNGKSTTVKMIEHLLKKQNFDCIAGGNIGVSASSILAKNNPEILILELSSYQLESSEKIKAKVAILTNIKPDHLERHKTFQAYFAAKWKLFQNQNHTDYAFIDVKAYHSAIDSFQFPKPKASLSLFEEKKQDKGLTFRWPHDEGNAMFALAAAEAISSTSRKDLIASLKTFTGLPHRCQIISTYKAHSLINDSKSTNLDSTMHALEGVQGRCTLFLGGIAKKESFHALLDFKETIHKIISFGRSAQKFHEELSSAFPVETFKTLSEALKKLPDILSSLEGDLLFSPGGASQDEFRDFEERGSFFSKKVHECLNQR